ncbi:MAG: pre-peptidase C-terminal domain-containing protein [Pirellulaceae bacterium]|nr:pre-peptidase C-terminal domain-containing protein [Pirellulaceae bacterium]
MLEDRRLLAALEIISLTADNAHVFSDHSSVTGDDRGGIAISDTHLFYTGDNSTGRFPVNNLAAGVSVGQQFDALVSDLATETVYSLGSDPSTPIPTGGGTVTHLLEHDGATGLLTGNSIALSAPIVLDSSDGIFAGSERAVVWEDFTGAVFEIAIPSGTVTMLGTVADGAVNHQFCENWAFWGVAEQFGGDDYLTYVDGNGQFVLRTRVSDGMTFQVADFGSNFALSDMCSFTVSASLQRWYFHHEGGGVFGGSDETVGFADAVVRLGPLELDQVAPDPRTTAVDAVNVTFDFAINPATFDFNDLVLRLDGGPNLINAAVSVTPLGGNTFQIGNLGSLTSAAGRYELRVNGAGIQDLGAAPLPGLAIESWTVDPLFGSIDRSVDPLGSLIYQGFEQRDIGLPPGGTQSLELSLDANQTLTVVGQPDAGLRAMIEVLDPSSAVIGSGTAAVPGDTVLLQTVAVPAAGTYTVRVSGVGGSTGSIDLTGTLNALVEPESLGLEMNNSRATADDLEASFIALVPGGDAARGAAVGRGDSFTSLFNTSDTTNDNFFSPNTYPIVINGLPSPTAGSDALVTVSSRTDLASSSETITFDFEGLFSHVAFGDTPGDDCELHVETFVIDAGSLAAILADNTMNITATPSSDVDDFCGVTPLTVEVTYGDGPASPGDFYEFQLAANDVVSLSLTGNGIVELQDAGGSVLQTSSGVGTNVDQQIANFVAPATGTYYARIPGTQISAADDYSLVVTRNAAFDTEANDSLGAAQSIDAARAVLGHVSVAGPLLAADNGAGNLLLTDARAENVTVLASSVGGGGGYTELERNPVTGVLHATRGEGGTDLYVIDPVTWTETSIGNPGSGVHALAWSPDGLTLYAVRRGEFGTIDVGTGNFSSIASLVEGFMGGMAFQPGSGLLFAVGSFGQGLFTINPGTGATTLVANTGSRGFNALEFLQDGTLVVGDACGFCTGQMFEMDPNTGVFTPLGQVAARNLTGLAALPATSDYYSFTAVDGETIDLRTFTPAGEPLDFPNDLDPAMELLDPFGVPVASDDNGALDGRNATLSYVVPAGQGGTYTVRVFAVSGTGEYVLDTQPPLTATTRISLNGDGNLLVEDVLGANSHDLLTLAYDPGTMELVITDPNNDLGTSVGSQPTLHEVRVPVGSIPGGQVIVNTFAGDDSLVIDPSMLASGLSIVYTAGTPTTPPGDSITLDLTGAAAPVVVDPVGGTVIVGGQSFVQFSQVETRNILSDGLMVDDDQLLVRSTGSRERIVISSWNDGGVRLRLDDLTGGTSTMFTQHLGLDSSGDQSLGRITVFAGDGDDVLSIASHVVDSSGDPIPVEFHGEEGNDYLAGGLGDDLLVGGPGNDRLLGGAGNDQLFGDGNVFDMNGLLVESPTDGPDNLTGGDGDDQLWGGGANDQLIAGAGADSLWGGSGNDRLDGGNDDDLLRGEAGIDVLQGGSGADFLLGGLDNDQLLGGFGHDILIGGLGSDILRGNQDNDLLVAGTTAQDSANDAALRALLAAWSGGTNNLSGYASDGSFDDLMGDTGMDEFWAEVTSGIDLVRDAAMGELVNDEP